MCTNTLTMNNYSLNKLAGKISDYLQENTGNFTCTFEFDDCDAIVQGYANHHYDHQKQTHEDPEIWTLKDVYIDIIYVMINCKSMQKFLTPADKITLAETIKNNLL